MTSFPGSGGSCPSGTCSGQQSQYHGMTSQLPYQTGTQNFSPFLVPQQAITPVPPSAMQQMSPTAPITPLTQPMPVTVESLQYINGYLRTQIGQKVTVDFLVGTGTLIDKTGTLLAVGANYIIINELETDDLLVCDFFNIKFVRIYH